MTKRGAWSGAIRQYLSLSCRSVRPCNRSSDRNRRMRKPSGCESSRTGWYARQPEQGAVYDCPCDRSRGERRRDWDGSTWKNVFRSLRLCDRLYCKHLKRCLEDRLLDITKDIQSLTTFRRRSGDFMKLLKKSKRPVILTVKGKAAAVVQDAEAYQRLLDAAAVAGAEEGIRQGLEDSRKRRVRPAKQFFDEFEARHGIRR